MKSKDSKKRLLEVMQRVAPNFTGKILNEYDNYNYPPGADADPSAPWHDKGEDEYESWDFDDKYNQVILHSTGGGWESVDWENLVPNETEANAIIAQMNANPKDPELIKKIDALVMTYLDTYHNKIDWQYPEPDEPDYDTMRKEH